MRVVPRAGAAAAGLGILTLGACAQHQERALTAWLTLDIVRPATGTSGVIVLGPTQEVFRARVGNEWRVLGSGHPCRYMVLAEEQAALVDLNDRKGVRIIRAGEQALRPLQDVFGRTGNPLVPPGRTAIDFEDCRVPAEPAGCRDLQIHRYDARGTLRETFHIPLPETYPECQLLSVRGYDRAGIPYVNAHCKMNSEPAKCLLLAARKDGLFVHAVGKDRPWSECSDFPGLGVSLSEMERFEVLF